MVKKILVVGTGSIGERHARCFAQVPNVEVSICEPNDEVRERVAKTYNFTQAFASWDAVPLKEFYAVVICTPAPFHIAMTNRAYDAGCHVLCEKPLALVPDGIDELITKVEGNTSGPVVGVAYVWRMMRVTQATKAVVDSGELGEIKLVQGVCGQEFPRYRPAYDKIYYRDRAMGGGAIQDALTHLLNLTEWIMGPCKSIYCVAEHLVLPRVEVEDTVVATMRFCNSPAIATIALNQFQKPNESFIEFVGTKSNVRFYTSDSSVRVYDPANETWKVTSHVMGERDEMYIAQAKAFLAGIEAGEGRPCTLRAGFATLKTVCAALASTTSGREEKTGN